MGARAGCSANAASLGRISRCVRRCGKLLQGHLVGSLLPIPEVEGKEGSRYPRHRWTDSVMCSYFQIRRRKDSADGRGILKPKKERSRIVTPSARAHCFPHFPHIPQRGIVNGNLGNCRTLPFCSVKAQLPRGSWCMVHPARSPAATLLAMMSHAHAHPHGTHAIPVR